MPSLLAPSLVAPAHTALALPVMEQFYTLQGEGAWAGTPAYFIRLGGCDVGCHWCDVKESWPIDAHPRRELDSLSQAAHASGAPLAVVTGGEPFMHALGPLTTQLQTAGLRTHVETSGAHPLSGAWDWVTLSPKKFAAARDEFFPLASELKMVIYHPSDLAWADQMADRVSPSCLLYLQPEWSRHERITPAACWSCNGQPPLARRPADAQVYGD